MDFIHLGGREWKKKGKTVTGAPLQISTSVPMEVAEEGYKEYVALYGRCQTLERLNERGGFSGAELAILLFQRIKRLEREQKAEGERF